MTCSHHVLVHWFQVVIEGLHTLRRGTCYSVHADATPPPEGYAYMKRAETRRSQNLVGTEPQSSYHVLDTSLQTSAPGTSGLHTQTHVDPSVTGTLKSSFAHLSLHNCTVRLPCVLNQHHRSPWQCQSSGLWHTLTCNCPFPAVCQHQTMHDDLRLLSERCVTLAAYVSS